MIAKYFVSNEAIHMPTFPALLHFAVLAVNSNLMRFRSRLSEFKLHFAHLPEDIEFPFRRACNFFDLFCVCVWLSFFFFFLGIFYRFVRFVRATGDYTTFLHLAPTFFFLYFLCL